MSFFLSPAKALQKVSFAAVISWKCALSGCKRYTLRVREYPSTFCKKSTEKGEAMKMMFIIFIVFSLSLHRLLVTKPLKATSHFGVHEVPSSSDSALVDPIVADPAAQDIKQEKKYMNTYGNSLSRYTEGWDKTSQYSYLVVVLLNWVPDNWVLKTILTTPTPHISK